MELITNIYYLAEVILPYNISVHIIRGKTEVNPVTKQKNRGILKELLNKRTDDVDNRSLFDKYVDQEALRENFFSDNSEFYKANPYYRIRTAQLRDNPDLLREITDDCCVRLLEGPNVEVLNEAELLAPHHFTNYNPIGEDFIIETQMFCVGYSNSSKTPICLTGFGFIYLNDCISGKKVLLGTARIHKAKTDPQVTLVLKMIFELFEEMTKPIGINDQVSFVIDKGFTGLRTTLLKHSSKFNVKIVGVRCNSDKGRKYLLKEITTDIRTLSPNFIDLIQLSNPIKYLH